MTGFHYTQNEFLQHLLRRNFVFITRAFWLICCCLSFSLLSYLLSAMPVKVQKSQLKTAKLGSELMELSQQCIFDRLCSLLAGKPELQPRVLELIESGALEKKEDDSKSDSVPGCTPESKKCLQSESVIGFSSWFFESCTLEMTCVKFPMSRCTSSCGIVECLCGWRCGALPWQFYD